MSIHDHFSPDYVTARAKFRAACAEAGFKTERFLNPETGMQSEDLTTDAVWIGPQDAERVLLTHHRKLNAWLQLGGHADGDADLSRVALREAEEESGLTDLIVEPAIFDIDRHRIPARPHEPEHWHYDVRYVVRATRGEDFVVGDESHDLAWRRVDELVDSETVDASVRRMAAKWLART